MTQGAKRMKINWHLAATIFGTLVTLTTSGCCGLAHSGEICCGNFPGKYYRATRLDVKFMVSKPIISPIVILTDLPFALVIETLETPFIATGLYDPRPKIPIFIKPTEIKQNAETEKKENESPNNQLQKTAEP